MCKLFFLRKNISIEIFYALVLLYICFNTPLNAQNIENSNSTQKSESQYTEQSEPPLKNEVRILPDVLFKNIQTKNKTELEILEAKINRIDNSKINKNEILEDQEQEKQRVEQLNILKNQLVEKKIFY